MNEFNLLIQSIIKDKKKCYFISPHLDDAALSAGGLIQYLSKHTEVKVITLFTESGKRNSLSAKAFIRQCNYSDSEKLFSDRRSEDNLAFKSIGLDVRHLGYVDGLWREEKKINPIRKLLGHFMYEFRLANPTYKFHISKGKINKSDEKLIQEIAQELEKIIGKNDIVFCPFGIGNHVDHIIARRVGEKISTPIYWIDQPYFQNSDDENKILIESAINFPVDFKVKNRLVGFYKTQTNALFSGSNIPSLEEKFIFKKSEQNRISVSDKNKSVVDYLKLVIRDIKLFIETPKDYLFSFTYSKDKKVEIREYDPVVNKVAEQVMDALGRRLPNLRAHFIGSASLGIAGERDVDIYAEAEPDLFNEYLPVLKEMFGEPSRQRRTHVEWRTKVDEYVLEFVLIDPTTIIFKKRMKEFNLLSSDKKILNEYQDLKMESTGISMREYNRRKIEFFNRVFKNI